jgi:hypothetical protein
MAWRPGSDVTALTAEITAKEAVRTVRGTNVWHENNRTPTKLEYLIDLLVRRTISEHGGNLAAATTLERPSVSGGSLHHEPAAKRLDGGGVW